ncbi:uncharacterized protein LOC114258248 [Camellia sinensis]|uniref:uncharacterized protein LOC114258248 n=1 Tax=Camellia sinensis TaxID=4442 RepID=UPI00103593A3|nr:uncharacterized protein LOC114258248 [Camellia sinensis]
MFEVGDHVFLKVQPRRGATRFGKKGKLAPRYVGPFEILSKGDIDLNEDASFEQRPIKIIDRREKNLRGKVIHLVQVLWQHRGVEESTWEVKDAIRANYPQLFEDKVVETK